MKKKPNGGFITQIAIILIALVILYIMGFSFKGFIQSDIVRHIIDIIRTGWGTLWDRGLGKILNFAWVNGLELWHLGWNGLLELIQKVSTLLPN
jgi:hypothetical protein